MVPMPRAILLALLAAAAPVPPVAAELPPVAREISGDEIAKTLLAINHDRTSGKDGEKKAAGVLEQKLRAYGVAYARHEMKAYLSWPGRASLEAVGCETVDR